MRKTRKTIEELMAKLPPDLQQEVRDFAQFLVEKSGRSLRKKASVELGRRPKGVSRPVHFARPTEEVA